MLRAIDLSKGMRNIGERRLMKYTARSINHRSLRTRAVSKFPMLMRDFQGDGDGEVGVASEGVGEEELGDKGTGEGVACSDFLRLTKAS